MTVPETVCAVWVKAHETAWTVQAADYPALMAAWQGGKAFATVTAAETGQPITFRLGEVIAVGLLPVRPGDDDDPPPPWAG